MKWSAPWIPIEKIDALIQLEPALVIVGFVFICWIIYKTFLKDLSQERHVLLGGLFDNLKIHTLVLLAFLMAFQIMRIQPWGELKWAERIASYLGIITLVWGSVVFVKTSRIFVFEYLFFGHKNVGVPVLLVNIFTLLLSVFLGTWVITEIFSIKVAPILATSAFLSVVLGLALQETLGNLFAGVALQFDKPYEIGDWIEVFNGGQKWVGKVFEISWRATVLTGFADEKLTIPNRVMAQAEVANFTAKQKPFARSLFFKLPLGVDQDEIKKLMLAATLTVEDVQRDPMPIVLLSEATESWLAVRVVYYITDYGLQFLIADDVMAAITQTLAKTGHSLAAARLQVNVMHQEIAVAK